LTAISKGTRARIQVGEQEEEEEEEESRRRRGEV